MNRKDRAPSDSRPRGLSNSKDKPFTVTQLSTRIESVVKDGFPSRIHVIAEISSVTNRTHYYFTLKDESATISAVLFASAARKQSSPPEHGQKVIASGKLDYYAPSGRLSFIVDKLEPVGIGDLEQRYKALCDDLRERGWFDPLTKRPLPIFPRSIAIITSATGAALQDVLDTAAKRCPAVNILVVDARMQGDHAKGQIASAINQISSDHQALGIDAIILTRGGGSLEDLWAFNEPIVAKAIHQCQVPIVAAIGHETDTTIAELVADERAATPTQAAMKLVPDRAALREQLDALTRRLIRELTTALTHHENHLNRLLTTGPLANPARLIQPSESKLAPLAARLRNATLHTLSSNARTLDALAIKLAKHQPAAVQAQRQEHIEGLQLRLETSIRTRFRSMSSSLDAAQRELNAIGPRQVLSRGYSLTTTKAGAVVCSTKDLKPGDPLTTHLNDGTVSSIVEGKKRTKRTKPQESQPQPSLFPHKD
jgi:exodeoxyribonuclease VII large subunit